MGFIREIYNDNHAALIVSFGGNVATENYTPVNNIDEAMAYFNLYVENGIIYAHTEADAIYSELELKNQEEVTTLKNSIAAITSTISDEMAITYPILFPLWGIGKHYSVGERVRYNDILYKVLQDHYSQDTWAPDVAPSLFAPLLIPDPNIIYDWVQPESTNGYMTGDKVRHNDIIWISTADNNVWEPGTTGAPWEAENNEPENSEPELPPEGEPIVEVNEWESGTLYNTGDQVSFNGMIYESTIDNNVWSPADYPAGWTLITE